MLGTEFIEQLLTEAKPHFIELVREVLKQEERSTDAISVDYKEAGRMIGTTYEGIRKMVRKGELRPVKRGRRRGIAVAELKSYVQRNTN